MSERDITPVIEAGEIYLWEDGGPKLTPLDEFTRTPLSTPYLCKPGEAKYHLCDEPFAYAPEPVSACHSGENEPRIRVLGQWTPRRASSSLVIEYSLPADGHACVDLYNGAGERDFSMGMSRGPQPPNHKTPSGPRNRWSSEQDVLAALPN